MFQIVEEFQITTSHITADSKGEATKIHGHKWHIKVYADAIKLNKFGKIEEFKDFRKNVQNILDKIDHQYLNEIEAFQSTIPTEERAAEVGFELLSKELNNDNLKISKIELWDYKERKVSYFE